MTPRFLKLSLSLSVALVASIGASTLGGSGCSRSDAAAPEIVEFVVGCDGDRLAYDVTELNAPAGTPIRIEFLHNAPHAKVYHNLIVVAPKSDPQVAHLAIAAGYDSGWVPDVPEVLAASPLLRPGERGEVLLDGLTPGDYPYICTVPGHCPFMRGTLRIR